MAPTHQGVHMVDKSGGMPDGKTQVGTTWLVQDSHLNDFGAIKY